VNAGARDFASREKPVDRRAAVEIRFHSAHDVMGGGPDRYAVRRKVQPRSATGGRNQRKPLVHERGVEVGERQVDRTTRSLRLTLDAARNAIARSQIAGWIVADHEWLARIVDETCAFPAKRLGEQESRLSGNLERGGMKLHELEIRHGGACAICHRRAVAGGDGGIGRVAVDVSGASGCQKHGVRAHDTD
jgi:hypothetical protein